MANIQIEAILWRKYKSATSTALFGLSASQYYIELPSTGGDYLGFVGEAGATFTDPQGNTSVKFSIAELDEGVCGEYEMTITLLAPDKARAGNSRIENQSPSNAYPLWQKERGPLAPYDHAIDEPSPQYAIVVRDVEKRFHARWLRNEDFLALPLRIQEIIQAKDFGVAML
jgi:hypothetical protein